MDERLYDAVEVCLAALRTGVDLDACLSLYPDLATELRPILEASLVARRLGRFQAPPPSVENRSRAHFLNAAAAMDVRSKPKLSWVTLRRVALVSLVVLVAFAISWNGLLVASAKSLPGDVLYPVKRVSERVNLRLMPNLEEKHQYESDFNLRRTEEVKLLLELGRVEHVSFEGTVTEITPNRWIVGGFSVYMTPDTVFVGEPKIGQFVEVEGQSQPGGWVNANEIHLRYFQFAGEVEQIEQDHWMISGTKFALSPNIQLDPGLHVHDQALALVQSNDDGNLTALAIMGIPADVQFNSQRTEIILEGAVEKIAENAWMVAGKNVRIDPQVQLTAGIAVGDTVRVHAYANLDGSLTATSIELLMTSQIAPFVPDQKFQDPIPDNLNEKFDLGDNDTSIDQAEPEDDSQNTVIEDNNETSSQEEDSNDHEEADDHQEDDGEHQDEEDQHKEDDQSNNVSTDNQHEDSPEVDD